MPDAPSVGRRVRSDYRFWRTAFFFFASVALCAMHAASFADRGHGSDLGFAIVWGFSGALYLKTLDRP